MSRRFQPYRLTELRTRAGKSREQLAAASRSSWWSVYAWESGKSAPSADNLARIADALDCRIDDLFAANGPAEQA
jgi:transcriptional regulator with XRE-family HTH domain